MNRKNTIYLLCFLLINIISCNNTEYETLIFDPDKDFTVPNIKIKSIVELESTDSSLIGTISKIGTLPNLILILDKYISRGLLVFNSEGEFLSKTKIGRGPGEISYPWDFNVNEETKTITIWDSSSFGMVEFNYNLNYKRTVDYPGLFLHSMESIDDEHILVSSQSNPYLPQKDGDDEFLPYNYFIYKKGFSELVNKLLPTEAEFCSFIPDVPICKTNRIIYLTSLDFNIYSLKKYKPVVIYNLDFGKLSITESDMKKGRDYILKQIKNGNKVGFLDNLFENEKFLSFSFARWMNNYFYIHSKSSGINYYSESLFQNKLLPKCQIKGITSDGYFIAIVNAYDLKLFLSENNTYNINLQEISEFKNDYILYFSIDEL